MKTAEQHRIDAKQHEQNAQESFERCDTDGFVSQWASGINAQLARAKADLIEAGGVSEFVALFEGERRVDAKIVNGRYGACWRLSDDESERFNTRFVPTDDSELSDEQKDDYKSRGLTVSRSRKQKSLGLTQKTELAPAIAVLEGSGRGLSGACSVHVAIVRVEKRYDGLGDEYAR